MFATLIVFSMTAYLRPQLYETDTYISVASQSSTFTLLLAFLMEKTVADQYGGVISALTTISFLVPLGTIAFVIGKVGREIYLDAFGRKKIADSGTHVTVRGLLRVHVLGWFLLRFHLCFVRCATSARSPRGGRG